MRYKRNGSELCLVLNENIVTATFKGPASAELLRKFASGIDNIIEPLDGQVWGLLCISDDLEAGTPQAELLLIDAIGKYLALGCRASAYVFPSAISQFQMDRTLKAAGILSGIEGKNFSTVSHAQQGIHQQLAQYYRYKQSQSPKQVGET